MRRSEFREQVDRELAAWPGVTFYREPRNGGHFNLIMSYDGRSTTRIEAGSPGEGRGLLNYISEMRKQLRTIGAERLSRKGGRNCDAHP